MCFILPHKNLQKMEELQPEDLFEEEEELEDDEIDFIIDEEE